MDVILEQEDYLGLSDPGPERARVQTQEFPARLAERLAAQQVLGDPVERDGVTLVPVAESPA